MHVIGLISGTSDADMAERTGVTMIDVAVSNRKLRARAIGIVADLDASGARVRLAAAGGSLREALGQG